MGDSEAPNCVTCSVGMVAGISGVHTGPGAAAAKQSLWDYLGATSGP